MARARPVLAHGRSVAARSALTLVSCLLLAGCGRGEPSTEVEATAVPTGVTGPAAATRVVESDYGTPVKDRVATLGLLNKRNNLSRDLVLRTGEARRIGNVIVKLANCERTLPWENPPEAGAFVQMWVEERQTTAEPLRWHKVFSGWLFRNSPSLNVVEHPIYDVWVKDCAMKFPGEEEDPAALAASSSAAKPSGKASAAPPAAAALSPAPAASAPAPAAAAE